MTATGRCTQNLYRFAWSVLPHLPTRVGYILFDLAADLSWLVNRLHLGNKSINQLNKNLSRLLPAGVSAHELSKITRHSMRSYMRYFYEIFTLVKVTERQIDARVRVELDPQLHADIASGSVVVALAHMGNWDLVGAWASRQVAPVLTVAERLEPNDLFEQFVDFRKTLGLHVIGQSRGEKVFNRLVTAAQQGHYLVALLADRDLSASGIKVLLARHSAYVAAGPAALAQKLKLPLYVASVSYERLKGQRARQAGGPWGVALKVTKVPKPLVDDASIVSAWTQDWARALGAYLTKHAVDWHMLQAVFEEDLDQKRLSKSRNKESL